MADKRRSDPGEEPRLYRDVAQWYPLLSPVADCAENAVFYRRLFQKHCRRMPRTVLDLGNGGGHSAAQLKATMVCTLVDRSPPMLELSQRLEHIARAAFEAIAVRFDHSSLGDTEYAVFPGLRPGPPDREEGTS